MENQDYLKNEIRTYGLHLSQELRPFQNKDIFGYRMDPDVLGKLSFYGDEVITGVNQVEDLKGKTKGNEEVLIITTEMGLQDLIHKGFLMMPLKKIDYRKGSMILSKIERFEMR